MTIKDIHTLVTKNFIVSLIRCGSYFRLFAGNIEKNEVHNVTPPEWMSDLIEHGGRWFEDSGDLVIESTRGGETIRFNSASKQLRLIIGTVEEINEVGKYNEIVWNIGRFTSLAEVKKKLWLDDA